MKKFLLSPVVAALVFSFNVNADSAVKVTFQNNSNEYVYFATKSSHDDEFTANTVLGWVSPGETNSIDSNDTWFTHLGITSEDRISIGFLDGYNNIIKCVDDYQLKNDVYLTLDSNMKCSASYNNEYMTRLSAYNLFSYSTDRYQVGWTLPVSPYTFMPLTEPLGYREFIRDEIVDYSHHGMATVNTSVEVQYSVRSEQTQEIIKCGKPVPAKGVYYTIMENGECTLVDYSMIVDR